MIGILGILIIFVMVFGGYLAAGGKLGIIFKALPFEMMIIGGAALGATITGNSMHELKAIGGGFGKIFKAKAEEYTGGSVEVKLRCCNQISTEVNGEAEFEINCIY